MGGRDERRDGKKRRCGRQYEETGLSDSNGVVASARRATICGSPNRKNRIMFALRGSTRGFEEKAVAATTAVILAGNEAYSLAAV